VTFIKLLDKSNGVNDYFSENYINGEKMTTSTTSADLLINVVETYFRKVGAGDPTLLDLFKDDVDFCFPKFGRQRGKSALMTFGERMTTDLQSIAHDIEHFNYIVAGTTVVVEGQERGVTRAGVSWPDGVISQGRFCSVFEFDGSLISRMHIYVDPDFTSTHIERIRVLRGESRLVAQSVGKLIGNTRGVGQTGAVICNPPGLYDPSRHKYSHMAIIPAGSPLVFLAGQFGVDVSGKPAGAGFDAQVRQAFVNIQTALKSRNLDFEHIIKLTVLIVQHDDEKLRLFEQVMSELFQSLAPVVTLIPVPRLAVEPMLVEVEAAAVDVAAAPTANQSSTHSEQPQ
jgi:enamine deaminase RidA (YjgF/YER057c/UK114 family)